MKIEEVFTFNNLYNSVLECCKGVRWKTSTKNFEKFLVENVSRLRKEVLTGTFKSKGFTEFDLCDRGKMRHIKAVDISERVIQKCLCDYYLIPLIRPKLIHDNGATLKGKGMKFALDRLKCHLQRFNKEYGTNGYVLKFDIKSYFDSINHTKLLNKIRKIVDDDKLFNLYKYFIDCFGEKGIGLGSQVSQISALFYLNSFDHYIKEQLHCKYYARYMDDGYIISESKEKLKDLILELKLLLEDEDLKLSKDKVSISKVTHFIFLKRHWTLYKSGYVRIIPNHKTLMRLKKKWKTIKTKDKKTIEQFKASVKGLLKYFKQRRLEEYVFA